jgi:hypothetical protein
MDIAIDLIILFLSYLNFNDFIHMKSFNKKLHEVISTKKLCWKNQVAKIHPTKTNLPQSLYQWAPLLLHLSIQFTNPVENCSLKGCSQLESLRLECSGSLTRFAKWARRECMAYKSVKKLSIYLTTTISYEYDNYPFYKSVPYNNTIEELEVHINQPKDSPEAMGSNKLVNFTKLRKLNVFHECCASDLHRTLIYVPTITELSVKCNQLNLLSTLENTDYYRCKHYSDSLKKLQWYYSGSNADINGKTAQNCATFKQLREFEFYGPEFSLPFLFSVLQRLPFLTTLRLKCNNQTKTGFYKWKRMTDEGIKITNITSLFLSSEESCNIQNIKQLFPCLDNNNIQFSL